MEVTPAAPPPPAPPAVNAADHLGLVWRAVRRSQRYLAEHGIEPEEAVGAGSVALVIAAAAFDPERGTKFSTCATIYIQNAIRELVRQTKFQRNGAQKKIVRFSEVTKAETREANQSLESQIADFRDDEEGGVLPAERAEVVALVRRAMFASLTTRERGILVRNIAGETMKTISDDIGVSKQRVQQILRGAKIKVSRWLVDNAPDLDSLL